MNNPEYVLDVPRTDEEGKCFMDSQNPENMYRQDKNRVLHLKIAPSYFIINTLEENFLALARVNFSKQFYEIDKKVFDKYLINVLNSIYEK